MSSILLKDGIALILNAKDHIQPAKTDILIVGNKIETISENISPPPGAQIVDCSSKIISPGFVSTHQHLWQTQLKGRSCDETFLEVRVFPRP